METWFLNHALGLSLSVLLLGLPGPLGAGTPSGDNNSTDSVTAGVDFSTATHELGDLESNATSTSHSGESSSASQRDILPTHTADTHTAAHTDPGRVGVTEARNDTEPTQSFTVTSSGSPEALSLYTEPLTSTHVGVTTEASSTSRDLKGFAKTDQVSDASPVVSWETSSWMLTEEAGMPQDSPDTTLRHGDASSSVPHTAVHTDSIYTSTAISRAGERTLLSVTSSSSSSSSSSSNSTSSAFTKNSNSHQPPQPSTWAVSARTTETEDYTHSAPSTSSDGRDTTDQHMTHSMKGFFSETGSPEWPRGSSNGPPNATRHQHMSTSEETSESMPPLRVTELSTDQSEASVSSTAPGTSPAEGSTSTSGTGQETGPSVGASTESSTESSTEPSTESSTEPSTESSTEPSTEPSTETSTEPSTESSTGVHSASTQTQAGPEEVSSPTTEQSVSLGPTTGPPTVSSRTSEQTDPLTDPPVLVTEVSLTTTPVAVTERPHVTEGNTLKATVSTPSTVATSATSPLAETSSSQFSSATSGSSLGSPTEATTLYAAPSTTSTNLAVQTSPMLPTHSTLSSQTREPSTGMANPINATTVQTETSTGTLGIPTAHTQPMTTTYPQSTPAKSTEALQTTWKQIDRGTTVQETTTSPPDIRSTKAPLLPRNPCESNPCLNGGMCVSSRGHQFTCRCQQAWTGPTCNQDMDECERDPCPVGSRCVNTRGSFSCECPLGFHLEDGRTCTRAKTFLGTFSVNRLPHDPVVFRSTTVYEIQREITQLLNASLSVLRGYSHSLLSKNQDDGVRISAVNMFSISTDVTSTEVYNSIQTSLSNCSSSSTHCRMVLHHKLTYHVDSLCVAQKTQCDAERSTCTDSSGTAHCQCHQGYYKHNPDDLSCLECGDGFKLENGTCVPCMFGFGGFNCGNFYKLIAVVVSPAGGALLLILIIALVVTCCKKDKNDINKIIFKSGDLQMSPYADFPKSNRISMEWGRETIEMQENGSTKNLLQMTDIYYSPALRNSDLERNGLYPFPGLPGSRHSCIYPAQWNPSFISDDSRRRDYF